jgi:pimeloyl-ACP methyl ester carboxylesterase
MARPDTWYRLGTGHRVGLVTTPRILLGHEFDWRGWERRLNAFHHFTWEGIHFVYQRAASGRGVPLILTHGWPSSFLDYVDMLPMLEHFDVVVPSLPGYGFSPRPPKVGINYRYVSERWHRLMSELGYSCYGASGYDFGAGVTTILALDHPESVIGIHPFGVRGVPINTSASGRCRVRQRTMRLSARC